MSRKYEIELAPANSSNEIVLHVTRAPVSILEPLLGVGDAWSFVQEADRRWKAGETGWAIEFEEQNPPDS